MGLLFDVLVIACYAALGYPSRLMVNSPTFTENSRDRGKIRPMNDFALILSTAGTILWLVAIALWLRGGAVRSTPILGWLINE
jgi:hypothetical protein